VNTPKRIGNDASESFPEGKPERDWALERLISFSDAVFAVAITLLALDIRLPTLPANVSDSEVFNQLLALGPKYYGFGISFLTVGLWWLGHHLMFQYIVCCDTILLLLDLLLLMFIVFIPFPLSVMVSNDYNRTASVFYALTLAITALVFTGMWLYASAGGQLLAHKPDRPSFLRFTLVGSFLTPTLFLLSAALALWSPFLAHILWSLIALVSFIITLLSRKWITKAGLQRF
jgi:uncharacterized membrane protein